MDKKVIRLLGGVSALALLGASAAVAAPVATEARPMQPAQSFGELLDPIPNAVSVLKQDDARMAAESNGLLKLAQDDGYGDGGGYYHHHHHHHHHFRRYYRQEYVPFREFYPRHHHHHHHWHHQYYGD